MTKQIQITRRDIDGRAVATRVFTNSAEAARAAHKMANAASNGEEIEAVVVDENGRETRLHMGIDQKATRQNFAKSA